MNKKIARLKRAKRARAKIRELKVPRLSVYRTPRHIYAQLISPDCTTVLFSASTVEKVFREKNIASGNIAAATEIGKIIAEKAKTAGISKIAFDRSGYKFHGRVKALAEAAREGGLDF